MLGVGSSRISLSLVEVGFLDEIGVLGVSGQIQQCGQFLAGGSVPSMEFLLHIPDSSIMKMGME